MKRNQIMNIDCLEGIKLVEADSVKLIIADPPYFLGMTHNGQKGSFVDLAICRPFYEELFKQFRRVLHPDGIVFWFCDWRGYAFYYPVFDSVMGASNLIVWDKGGGPGSKLSYSHELIIPHFPKSFVRGGAPIWKIKAFSSGAKKTDGEKVHPTQKPLGLIKYMIEDFSSPGDLVLDPFTGSGTSAIAARQKGRNFIGFELDISNFEIARSRVAKTLGVINLE